MPVTEPHLALRYVSDIDGLAKPPLLRLGEEPVLVQHLNDRFLVRILTWVERVDIRGY